MVVKDLTTMLPNFLEMYAYDNHYKYHRAGPNYPAQTDVVQTWIKSEVAVDFTALNTALLELSTEAFTCLNGLFMHCFCNLE